MQILVKVVIRTHFELESIKDQIALIKTLTSHIDIAQLSEKELDKDYKTMLMKAEKTGRNLEEKLESLNKILNN